MLVRCLYASRPVEKMTGLLLDDILEQSRQNNAALGVTGMLCVSEDLFIQVIEGGRDEVCELFNAIVRDAYLSMRRSRSANLPTGRWAR